MGQIMLGGTVPRLAVKESSCTEPTDKELDREQWSSSTHLLIPFFCPCFFLRVFFFLDVVPLHFCFLVFLSRLTFSCFFFSPIFPLAICLRFTSHVLMSVCVGHNSAR